jgi:antitoxin (DNA-binding transcriptional repressor) of toxin-antitoxin stability system
MATFHISREEAVKDIDGLIARVSKGDEIIIEENYSPVAVLQSPGKPKGRLLSETLRILEERGSKVTLDDQFGKDLTDIINSHREPLIDPLNDPWA